MKENEYGCSYKVMAEHSKMIWHYLRVLYLLFSPRADHYQKLFPKHCLGNIHRSIDVLMYHRIVLRNKVYISPLFNESVIGRSDDISTFSFKIRYAQLNDGRAKPQELWRTHFSFKDQYQQGLSIHAERWLMLYNTNIHASRIQFPHHFF